MAEKKQSGGFNLDLQMKLRRYALAGEEWALDMLIADGRVGALADAAAALHAQMDDAIEKARVLNVASEAAPFTGKAV